MSLKPWEEGYKAPAKMTEAELAARRSANCALAGRQPKKGMRGQPDPESKNSQRIARMEDDNLTDKQIRFVEDFVTHYLKCFDAPQAYLMAGGSIASVGTKAYEVLRWPAVQQRLEKVVSEMEEEELLTRKDILVGLKKEANYHGHDSSHGARIRAWMGLARIKKMDVQVTESTHTVKGGVMLIPVVPQAETIDGWAQVVTEEQARLKEEVRK